MFHPDSTAPLAMLLKALPDICYPDPKRNNSFVHIRPIEVFQHFSLPVNDMLESAILLDIIRGTAPSDEDQAAFILKGWSTEVHLALKKTIPEIDYTPLFYPLPRSIHPSLPYNPVSAFHVRNIFQRFKARLMAEPRYFYPRATHKNMSRSTRRDYEQQIGGNLEILKGKDNIFGQDDWQRVYHDTGIQLEGEVEMRQKWYPSGAKPRTYFAMGGTCYRDSRFLQDFFTELVNLFPSTNHITRLQPERLQVPNDGIWSFKVYDLSSFTSNMAQQREFCRVLSEFMRGVTVILVDERYGPTECDLGQLLDDYNATCVNHPTLSFERTPDELGWSHIREIQHLTASLLGIFGNLMSCTLAHFLTLTPAIDDPVQTDETAGDDGLAPDHPVTSILLHQCISFVGEYAIEKTYNSRDEGAVCLKRPLVQWEGGLLHGQNVVPPTLINAISYLSGRTPDSRFVIYGLEEMSLRDRVSVVGVDLMRFLSQCHKKCRQEQLHSITDVYEGFCRLRDRLCNPYNNASTRRVVESATWPLHPGKYDFFNAGDPFFVWASVHIETFEIPLCDHWDIEARQLRYAGDVVKGNSTRRLVLLERLGYLEKRDLVKTLVGVNAASGWYRWYNFRRSFAPVVYEYTCIKDVPVCFLFDE